MGMASLNEYYHIATDDTLRESKFHGSGGFPFAYYLEDAWQFDFHRIDWHWHYEVEFVTVMEGKLICLIGEERIELPAGFGLFVNSGILHRFEAAEKKTIIPNIVFSPVLFAAEESLLHDKYVLPVIHSPISYQVLNPRVEWQNEILKALSAVYSLGESGKNNELQVTQLILRIWEMLFEAVDTVSETSGIRHVNHRQAKLRIMMQYIHDHYGEPITLEEIAGAALISKSSALNIFQAGIHITPVAYLIQYRLKCASRLLYTTEKTVSVIAEETGFSDAGYFCRKFKEYYHMTPGEYKRKKLDSKRGLPK